MPMTLCYSTAHRMNFIEKKTGLPITKITACILSSVISVQQFIFILVFIQFSVNHFYFYSVLVLSTFIHFSSYSGTSNPSNKTEDVLLYNL